MNFINSIKERAKKEIKTIVLPETDDIRVLKGAEIVIKEKFANIILIGNEENIKELTNSNNINIDGTSIVDPQTYEKTNIYINELYELRKDKGVTIEQKTLDILQL